MVSPVPGRTDWFRDRTHTGPEYTLGILKLGPGRRIPCLLGKELGADNPEDAVGHGLCYERVFAYWRRG